MINVTETRKLTKLDFNGKEIVVNSEDTTVWTQVKIDGENNEIVINEGDTIKFIANNGEGKEGILSKIGGKKDKTKLTITFDDEHEETWGICSIREGTLKIVDEE